MFEQVTNENEKLEIIRGTTPTITIKIKQELDFTTVTQIWVYITQKKVVKVDKVISDVTFDSENNQILAPLTQEDTLALKEDIDALFQFRILLNNGLVLGIKEIEAHIYGIGKEGKIQ